MNLKDARKRSGYTQEQAAKKLGIDRSTVTKWETGKSMPRVDKLIELAHLYSCTVDELLTGSAAS